MRAAVAGVRTHRSMSPLESFLSLALENFQPFTSLGKYTITESFKTNQRLFFPPVPSLPPACQRCAARSAVDALSCDSFLCGSGSRAHRRRWSAAHAGTSRASAWCARPLGGWGGAIVPSGASHGGALAGAHPLAPSGSPPSGSPPPSGCRRRPPHHPSRPPSCSFCLSCLTGWRKQQGHHATLRTHGLPQRAGKLLCCLKHTPRDAHNRDAHARSSRRDHTALRCCRARARARARARCALRAARCALRGRGSGRVKGHGHLPFFGLGESPLAMVRRRPSCAWQLRAGLRREIVILSFQKKIVLGNPEI